MIDFDFSKHCCGCGACVDICPRHCITIIEDTKGFRVPKVSAINCNNCGLCNNVCPTLNSEASKGLERLFCCYNKNSNQRKAGSSGSIFVLLADTMIKHGGVVVGAAFDSDLQLRHQIASTMDDVKPLMKSKYIQSDTTGIFKRIKEKLISGKVLFVGSPCQCHALYNFLGRKPHDNLLIVDFICHGVPSQKLFNNAINLFEKKRGCKVKAFSFREKAKGELHCYSISYVYNGEEEVEVDVGCSKEFPYYNGYLNYNVFRESCYECKFARRERVSDITLGDFWGLSSLKRGLNDFRKGYSMMIVNSEEGQSYIHEISSDIEIEEYPIEVAIDNNFAYTHPTKKKLQHKLFIRDFNVKSYLEVENKYLRAPEGIRQEIRAFFLNVLNSLISLF